MRSQPALKAIDADAPSRPSPRIVDVPKAHGPLPHARELQALLAARFDDDAASPDGRRWRPRQALALAAGASTLLWAAIGAVAYVALRS